MEVVYGVDASRRCYWICDSINYVLIYWLLVILTRGRRVHLIVISLFPFAWNKLYESIFTAETTFDVTEYICFALTVLILVWKWKPVEK